ncbi:MAG: exopolysaccharide biosynthesis protein exod [Azospirillum sp.]|nr:exopolysaccharide biosynthesis protein exod [Azospirillum sp.]
MTGTNGPVPPAEAEASDVSASAMLRDLLHRLDGDKISLGDLVGHLGERAPAFLFLVQSVFCGIPTPPPLPAGVIFGTVLMLVALHVATGSDPGHLPGWLARRRLPVRQVAAVIARAIPLLERIERVLKPRGPDFSGPARCRALAAVVVAMGALVALPIPFGNALPSLSAGVIALGMIARDGAAVVAGLICAALSITVSAILVGLAWWAVVAVTGP